jgi:DNA-binding NtrC family response regulator
MMDLAVLERETMGLVDGPNKTGSLSEVALNNRIKALRELTLALLSQVEALGGGGGQPPEHKRRSINLYDEVRRFETDIIRYALMRTGGHQRRAARLLGVKVSTLNAKIKRYNIQLDEVLNNAPDLYLIGKSDSSENA